MGKLMVRKIVVSVLLAILTPFILIGVMLSEVTGLVLVNNSVLNFQSLIEDADFKVFLIMMAVWTFAATFIASLLVPSRRRRNRTSGTVVEEDTEDGRERGVVKWFNVKKGFGFIAWDEGEDVFVHFRSIRGQGHRSLAEGQRVKFSVVQGDKGPQAEDVSALR